MHSFTVLSALAATVLALPHNAHNHVHPARSPIDIALPVAPIAPVADTQSLEARQTSLPIDPLGQCGGDSGFGCADGLCCSKWGYCGQSDDYCGAGCLFGACLGGAAPSSSDPAGSDNSTDAGVASKAHDPPTYLSIALPIPSIDASAPGGAPPAYTGAPSVATTFATQYTAPSAPAYTAPEPSSTPAAPTYNAPAAPTSAPAYNAPSSSSAAAPAATSSSSSGSTGGGSGFGDSYKLYSGDGSTTSGWPSQSDWMSFEDAWSSNVAGISASCAQWNVPNNSDEENSNLESAIQSVAQESGVDERFILAVIRQESGGCVRAPTTVYSVRNPGLMQSHNGKGTCNEASNGGVQSPCPMSEITQMIKDGVTGTTSNADGGAGLQQGVQQAGCDDVSRYYKAARIYNSGSIPSSGNLGDQGATSCYATDVANRLTGWTSAPCGCS